MKKNIIYAMLLFGLILAGCTDMNDVSKEFMGPEIRYAGAPDTLKVLGGKERIVLNFRLNDKSVNRIDVFWNNRTDTLIWDENDFVIDATPKEFFIEIPGLTEGAYSFEVITHDVNGNKSVVTRAAGKAYGESYQNSLLSNTIQSDVDLERDVLDIVFGFPDASTAGMEIYYTNKAGEDAVRFFKVPKIVTEFIREVEIDDYQRGTNIKYRTCFTPEENAVDTFYTPLTEIKIRNIVDYNRNSWTVVSGDPATGNIPQRMLDGDASTYWQAPALQRNIVIDMGESVDISGFYVQKLSGGKGIPKEVALYVSESTTFNTNQRVAMSETNEKKQRFDLTSVQRGRYLRFVVISKFNASADIPQIAEFGVYKVE